MAITTVDTLNTYLGETGTSSAKTAAVNAACGLVEDYCDTSFDAVTRYEWHYLSSASTVLLQRSPITAITRVTDDSRELLQISGSGNYTSHMFSVAGDPNEGDVTLTLHSVSTSASGTQTIAMSDYPTTTLLMGEINNYDGWSCTVVGEEASNCIRPCATMEALNQVVSLYGPGDAIECIQIDHDGGMLYLRSPYTGWVFVEYTAGYTNVPAGLAHVATQLAAAIYQSLSRDQTLTSEKLGDYSYTRAVGMSMLSAYESQLNVYRRRRL